MAVLGDASDWAATFPGNLIPKVLDLILTAWHDFEKPGVNELEVSITRRFKAKLKRAKDLDGLPFIIGRQVKIDSSTGQEIGEIDLSFTAGKREEVYFAFECKRLRVWNEKGIRSNASEYVTQGMVRFVKGQYALHLNSGGMIGYVMDGQIDPAIAAVSKTIRNKRAKLQMAPAGALEPSSIIPGSRQVRETVHQLMASDFVIHHIFLPVEAITTQNSFPYHELFLKS